MRVIRISLVFAVGLFGMFLGSARADEVLNVTVPFAFVVGHQSFPAGRYEVSDVFLGSDVFAIRGAPGSAAVGVAMTTPATGHDPAGARPALVFHRYENTYRLTHIWESGTQGRALTGLASPKAAGATARLTPAEDSIYVVAGS